MFRLRDSLITLDAYGTLLELEPPAPRLKLAMEHAGFECTREQVEAGIAAEVGFYLQHLNEGRDEQTLFQLRTRCAEVVRECLDDPPPLTEMTDLLMGSMQFRLFPEVVSTLAALRDAGYRLAVVSNWDCSLSATLATLGIDGYFETVVTSAEIGCSKPDPRVFQTALGRLGVHPRDALHCGDVLEVDCLGARNAGMQAVHVARGEPGQTSWPCTAIESLHGLPSAAGALLRLGVPTEKPPSCSGDDHLQSDLSHLHRI